MLAGAKGTRRSGARLCPALVPDDQTRGRRGLGGVRLQDFRFPELADQRPLRLRPTQPSMVARIGRRTAAPL